MFPAVMILDIHSNKETLKEITNIKVSALKMASAPPSLLKHGNNNNNA